MVNEVSGLSARNVYAVSGHFCGLQKVIYLLEIFVSVGASQIGQFGVMEMGAYFPSLSTGEKYRLELGWTEHR